jgi:hypothetical protein
MFGSTVLELALGLCVFYIALSLVCSGVTQYLAEWRQWRGRILVGMLSELVNHTAHDGESIVSSLLADARIAGGSAETKPKAATPPDKTALVLPAGGRIDKFVFTDTLLDLIAGMMIKKTGTSTSSPADGAGAGQAPFDPTGALVQRLQSAIDSLQNGLTISLSGPDLAKWDALLKDLKTRIDTLKGQPLSDVNQQAEAILKILQIAATAEGQAEIRARLLEAIGQESEAVLGLARRLTTARSLALFAQDMPESPFRSFLIRLANRGALEPEEVRKAIQDWYTSVNDRVSVEYRGKTKRVLFVTAVGVALLLNADTFQVANRLVKDDALRKVVTQDALQLAAMPNNAPAAGEPAKTSAVPPPASSSSARAGAVPNPPAQELVPGSLDRLNLPLRWTEEDWDKLRGIVDFSQPREVFNGLYKIFGLMITALALTMGAEFWYNLLKQLVPSLPSQKGDQPSQA